MKIFAYLLMLVPVMASADFVAGRVRTEGTAQMEVLSASGIYKNASQVIMNAKVEDGKGLVGYSLTVDGKTMRFTVTSDGRKNSGCGNKIEAVALTTMESALSSLIHVTDYSQALCERTFVHKWEVTLQTHNLATGEVSVLELGGNPEYMALSL
ncbi:MAG: hypothetical protein ACXVBE_00155 [Bdellovibrionota bacterium]